MFGLKFLALMLVGLLLCLCVLPAVNECEASNDAAAMQNDEAAIDTCFLRDLRPLQWLGKRRPFRWLRSCSLNESLTLSENLASEDTRKNDGRRDLQFERLLERENR